jgi:hypothetical protein
LSLSVLPRSISCLFSEPPFFHHGICRLSLSFCSYPYGLFLLVSSFISPAVTFTHLYTLFPILPRSSSYCSLNIFPTSLVSLPYLLQFSAQTCLSSMWPILEILDQVEITFDQFFTIYDQFSTNFCCFRLIISTISIKFWHSSWSISNNFWQVFRYFQLVVGKCKPLWNFLSTFEQFLTSFNNFQPVFDLFKLF